VHWDGTVRNNQKVCSFPASYSVQLQSRVGYSGVWQTIARFDGAGTFPPGDTVLQGNFCYGTRNTDLVFYRTYILLNGPTLRCKAESISPFIDACVHPTACALFAPLPVGR
jgi:hypothetical protein